eukprot:TRINITY_DN43036_c0_g1_i1.p1 TRINITY_DN43036_c0_g1~~TRINITY_DN43036_c0_g1_i1.p1  ORF type:complete len:1502 (+),score=496.27 TRINITY_DN43036_c0_g1_i1:50-4507(+)
MDTSPAPHRRSVASHSEDHRSRARSIPHSRGPDTQGSTRDRGRRFVDSAVLAGIDRARGHHKSEILAWEQNKLWPTDWHPWELYSLYRFFTRNIKQLAGDALELHQVKEFAAKCPCYFHGEAWDVWFRDPMVLECTIDGADPKLLLGDQFPNDCPLRHEEGTLRLTDVGHLDQFGLQAGWEVVGVHSTTVKLHAHRSNNLCGLGDAQNTTGRIKGDADGDPSWRGWDGVRKLHPSHEPPSGYTHIGKGLDDAWRELAAAATAPDPSEPGAIVQLLLRPPVSQDDVVQPQYLNRMELTWWREDSPLDFAPPLRWTVHPDGDVSHCAEESSMRPVDDEDRDVAGDSGVRLFSTKGGGYAGYHADGGKRQSVVLGGPPTRKSKQGEDTWAKGCPICTYIFEPEAHHDQRTRSHIRVPSPSESFESWHWSRKKAARLFKALMRKVEVARAGRVGKGEHAMTPFEFCKSLFKLMGESRDVGGVRIRSGCLLQAHLVFKAFDFDEGGCLDQQELLAMLGAVGGINVQSGQEEIRSVFDKLADNADGVRSAFDSERASLKTRPWISKLTLARVLDLVARNPKHDFAGLVLNLAHITTYRLMRPANRWMRWMGGMPCCGGWEPPVNPLEYPGNIPRPPSDPLNPWCAWSCCVEKMEPFTDEVAGSAKGPPTAQELFALYVAFTVITDQGAEMTKDAFLQMLQLGSNRRGDVEVSAKSHPGLLLRDTDARELGFTNELRVASNSLMIIHLKNVWLSRMPRKVYCGFRRNTPPKTAARWNEGAPDGDLQELPNTFTTPHGIRNERERQPGDPAPEKFPVLEKLSYDAPRTAWEDTPANAALFEEKAFQQPLQVRRGTREFLVGPADLDYKFFIGQSDGAAEVVLVGPLGLTPLQGSGPLLPSVRNKRRTIVRSVYQQGKKERMQPASAAEATEAIHTLLDGGDRVVLQVESYDSLLTCTRCESADVHVDVRVEKLGSLKRSRPDVLGLRSDGYAPSDTWEMLGLHWRHALFRGGLCVAESSAVPKGSTPFSAAESVMVDVSDAGDAQDSQRVPVSYPYDLSGRELRAIWVYRTAHPRPDEPPRGHYFTVGPLDQDMREPPDPSQDRPRAGHIVNGEELVSLLAQIVKKGDFTTVRGGRASFNGNETAASVVFTFGPQRVQHVCADICGFPQDLHRVRPTELVAGGDLMATLEEEPELEHLCNALHSQRRRGEISADGAGTGPEHHDVLCGQCMQRTIEDERVIDRSKADALFNYLDRENGDGNGRLSQGELLYGVLEALGKLDQGGSPQDALRAKQLFVWVFFAHADESEDGFLEEREVRHTLEEIIRNYSYRDASDRDQEAGEKVEEFFRDLNLAWEQPEAATQRESWAEEKRKECRRNLRDRRVDKELLTLLLEYKEPGMVHPKWDFLIPYFAHEVTASKMTEKRLCYFKECIWCNKCGGCVHCEWRESCDDGNCEHCNFMICDLCRKVDLELEDMPEYHCSKVFGNPTLICC